MATTLITGSKATIACAGCGSKITYTDVIRRYADFGGEFLLILFAPYTVDINNTRCIDCDRCPEDIESLMNSAPAHDDESNYVITNNYKGI